MTMYPVKDAKEVLSCESGGRVVERTLARGKDCSLD